MPDATTANTEASTMTILEFLGLPLHSGTG